MSRGLDIDIRSNIKEITKYLTRTQRKQIPYAAKLCLEWCMYDVRDAEVAHTKAKLKNRKAWYRPKSPVGLHVVKPTKKRLAASVYTRWAPAELHDKGGIRTAKGSSHLLVPTDRVPKTRRTPGGAAYYLAQKSVYSDKKGIWRRLGKKKEPNLHKQLLYWKVKRARIKPILQWDNVAKKLIDRTIDKKFNRAITKALATAR